MAGGYMGKLLWVDLSKGKISEEILDEKLARDYIGGYGIGARLIYDRQKPGADPLGPENILGFITGPLTGTDATWGNRYTVMVGRSPLTGGTGDANSGGDFGPYLKFAGYDAVFVTGAAKNPTYLFVKDGKAELKDASQLWGKDCDETEDALEAELGKSIHVACIGPAGEKLSLVAAIINNRGRAAARSGVGAVMGSKKLKAIVVIGSAKIPVAKPEEAKALRKEAMANFNKGMADFFKAAGTSGAYVGSAKSGDAPVKNWRGNPTMVPNPETMDGVKFLEHQEKRYGCYKCPNPCGGIMKEVTGDFATKAGQHRPEYETIAMFGSNLLNGSAESLIKLNDICNRYGLDTISVGGIVAFAFDLYEQGILTRKDVGFELKWGDAKAIVALTEKIAKREGIGDILADGVKQAAAKIGKGAEKYAIHNGGQELPAHDPRCNPAYGVSYETDATPGRHTQSLFCFVVNGLPPGGWTTPVNDRYDPKEYGKSELFFRNLQQLFATAGICQFSNFIQSIDITPRFLKLVTGWDISDEELKNTCERISAIRQALTLREGINPVKDYEMPKLVIGEPPLKEGPTAGKAVRQAEMDAVYYKELQWDPKTAKPTKKRLLELGLTKEAKDIWG